ncbi:MAG: hypothetical protein LBQ09_08480, partial [Acidobacteriaceae bacterium]|nr:hypothetical protein [Acidobacteriaceae bacterium]
MRTEEVIDTIKRAARAAGVTFTRFERAHHTGLQIGPKRTTIGRHRETSNLMAERIYKQLED